MGFRQIIKSILWSAPTAPIDPYIPPPVPGWDKKAKEAKEAELTRIKAVARNAEPIPPESVWKRRITQVASSPQPHSYYLKEFMGFKKVKDDKERIIRSRELETFYQQAVKDGHIVEEYVVGQYPPTVVKAGPNDPLGIVRDAWVAAFERLFGEKPTVKL